MRTKIKLRIPVVFVLMVNLESCLAAAVSDGDIRLTTDRNTQNEGLLEIYYNGRWGCVDPRDITDTTASVVCRLLGLGNKGYEIQYYYQNTSNLINKTFNYLYCNGDEDSILDCNYGLYTGTSSRYYGAGVVCNDFNVTLFRLEGGNTPSEGRIQFFVNGIWVYMCGNVNYNVYNTACRTMGYRVVESYSQVSSSTGSTNNLLPHTLSCSSNSLSLKNCNTYVYSYTNCSKPDDRFIKCADFQVTDYRLVNGRDSSEGRIEVQDYDGRWKSLCRIGLTGNAYNTICRQLGFTMYFSIYNEAYFGEGTGDIIPYYFYCYSSTGNLSDCFVSNYNYSCQHSDDASVKCRDFNVTDVRLVNGNTVSEGRVEFLIRGSWMSVCDRYFYTPAADTVCRMQGYRTATDVFNDAYFGEGTGEIAMNYVSCNSFETDINNCVFRNNPTFCTHSEDVSVRCSNYQISDVRLVGGNVSSEGRVELKVDGEWKTICDNRFYGYDAQTVCRTLGYKVSLKRYNNAYFGQGTGDIIKNYLGCSSDNYHVNDCRVRYHGYICGHSDDASVKCSDFKVKDLRLVGGRHSNEGRVEMLVDDEWRTVCRSYWYTYDYHVLCKTLGFVNMTKYWTNAHFGEGTGDILTVDYTCNGKEDHLDNCSVLDRGNTCSHSSDLSISCLACAPFSIPLNGYMQLSGTTHGDFVRFECQTGYGLVGSSFRVCQTNNTWNGTEPSCVKDCGIFPAPLNGTVSFGANTLYNATSTFTCDMGFDLVGMASRSCQVDGLWNGTSPVCQIKDCGPLTALKNGSIDLSSGTVFKSTAQYTCDPGFEVYGIQSRVCQQDGVWSSEKPVCIVQTNEEQQSETEIWKNGLLYGGVALGLVIGVILGIVLFIVIKKKRSAKKRDSSYLNVLNSNGNSESAENYETPIATINRSTADNRQYAHYKASPRSTKDDNYSYIDFNSPGMQNSGYTS